MFVLAGIISIFFFQFVINLLSDAISIIDPVKNYSGAGLGSS